MSLVVMLAMMGQFADDLFAMLSFLGSGIMLVGAVTSGAPMRRFGKIAEWSILGLLFGGAGQIANVIAGSMPQKIGLFQLSPGLVNGLLILSFLMLLIRWIVRRNRY